MKKSILFLVFGIAAGIALCLIAAFHLPLRKDEATDWFGFF